MMMHVLIKMKQPLPNRHKQQDLQTPGGNQVKIVSICLYTTNEIYYYVAEKGHDVIPANTYV